MASAVETSPDASVEAPGGQPTSLIQVAGWALADIGVCEPGVALLEPVARALMSLDVCASCKE